MARREQLDPIRYGVQPNGVYAPGPIEIERRCVEIRTLWTANERIKRAKWAKPVRVTVQEIGDSDL